MLCSRSILARPSTRRWNNLPRRAAWCCGCEAGWEPISFLARPRTRRWENLPRRAAWCSGCEAGGEQSIHELLSGCRSGISSSSRRRRAGMYGWREWDRERGREAMVSTRTLARERTVACGFERGWRGAWRCGGGLCVGEVGREGGWLFVQSLSLPCKTSPCIHKQRRALTARAPLRAAPTRLPPSARSVSGPS